MEPVTDEQKIAELRTQIEGSIQIMEHCPVESAREIAQGKLVEYRKAIWDLAAASPKNFETAKELEEKIKPHLGKLKGGRGPAAPKIKQPTVEEVRGKISGVKWDGVARLGDEAFWKRLLGGAAVARIGADTVPLATRCSTFMRAVIVRTFRPGSKVEPLILIGPNSSELAARLSPSCLPEPYRTSVGHLVPSRASLLTLFDGVGSSLDAGPFATSDKLDGDVVLERWFSPVCHVKRPTPITDAAGAVLCQGTGPGTVTSDEILQLWAETYKVIYDTGDYL